MKTIKVKDLFFSIIFLALLTLVNTCNSNKAKNYSKITVNRIDSLCAEIITIQTKITYLIDNNISKNDLKIEGLNAELRAIEATDRRKIDMDRQGKIRDEIEKLKNEKTSHEKK